MPFLQTGGQDLEGHQHLSKDKAAAYCDPGGYPLMVGSKSCCIFFEHKAEPCGHWPQVECNHCADADAVPGHTGGPHLQPLAAHLPSRGPSSQSPGEALTSMLPGHLCDSVQILCGDGCWCLPSRWKCQSLSWFVTYCQKGLVM